MIATRTNTPLIDVVTKTRAYIDDAELAHKKFFEDEYAQVSFIESIPCIKVRVTGVPKSSDHYQFVQHKILESIQYGMDNYCRMHLLTDATRAGIVLDEDIEFYKTKVSPALEKAGIRFHAIILPSNNLLRLITSQNDLSTRKLKVEYFTSIRGATTWLKNH